MHMTNPNQYTAARIADIIKSDSELFNGAAEVHFLITDSRRIIDPHTSLFFALRGKQDGHEFIPLLYNRGIRNFVISTDSALDLQQFPESNFIRVRSPLTSFQLLARVHREQFHYPVIGITGSNGKTIVKEWLYQLLSTDKHIVRSPKSFNSQIGVPLSVWQMSEVYDLGIFEAGISQPEEMSRLRAIIQPDIGILTNIGPAHDMGFEHRQQKIREKLVLFDKAKVLIYSKDYVNADFNRNTFTWSFHKDADLRIFESAPHLFNTSVTGRYQGKTVEIEIPFTDKASIENAVICWSTMLYMGYAQDVIRARMLMLSPIAMRLELKQAINNCSLINDSYNFDLPSLDIAIDFLNQQQQHIKKTVILSDMLQTGIPERELYEEMAFLLRSKNINRMIGIGEAISRNADLFLQEKQFFRNTDEFLQVFDNFQFQNESILLKGARVFEFERISRLFERKVHDTILEINLNSVIHNYNFYKSQLKPATRIMAMVKAFSYGSGSFEIASILQYHRVDYLAVAYVDEGIALRNSGIETPVLVLNAEVSTFTSLIKYGLEPEIFSMRILKEFVSFLIAERIKTYPVQLKIDTGMHRLGFNPSEVDILIDFLKAHPVIHVNGIFSHLAASEDAAEDDFTNHQLQVFTDISDKIIKSLDYPVIRHISNTAAISRFPEAQFEMVRLGIGLYGLAGGKDKSQLQHVGTLKTAISQLRDLKAGDQIGYNLKGVLTRDSRIATVKIGYADGYRRALGNGNSYMLVRGQVAPVIGNICMDMTMIDVTGIECMETDEVVVFNDTLRVEQLAKLLDTNEYEVITNISQRVKRVYYYE